MKDLTIKQRIIFGFAGVIVIAVGLGIFAGVRLLTIRQGADRIATNSMPGLLIINRIESLARQNYGATLQYLLADDAVEKQALMAFMQTNIAKINQLTNDYAANITSARDRDQWGNLLQSRITYVASFKEVCRLDGQQKKTESLAAAHSQMDPAYEKFMDNISNEVQNANDGAKSAVGQIRSAVSSAQKGIVAGVLAMFVIAVVISFLIIRGTQRVLTNVSTALNEGSAQVAAAAGQVSSASQTLAEGASEQAASIEETSASLEEMSSMTRRNAENAQKANDLAKQTRVAADKGAADMETMNAAMEAIKTSSNDIAKIIKTIDEIAFQTNILALNAAVEAARAGEAGLGFAVVADEVRNLAQRSANAAKETAAKIEGAISKTGQGVGISKKVAETLNEIVTKARQVDELAAEVASASREQTQGITQINAAVGQMDKVTQSNAASAEESAAAAEELNAQAFAMRESVTELLQLVGSAEKRPERTGSAMPKTEKKPFRKTPVAHNSNGHAVKVLSPDHEPAPALVASRRDEIPLDGDFKDF